MRTRRLLGIVLYGLLAVAVLLAFFRQEAIGDWFRLRGYQPPASVAALADETAMTGQARHLFYINHPGIEDKPTFRNNCPDYGEQTIVIGCYQGGQRGIHLLAVDDERLAGVEQVTAAHEMLHAAYERLGKSEKTRINGLLQNYADNSLKDERLINVLKGYEKTEPGEQHNEMHSIFGTEVAGLPAELEEYYSRYFSDRASVVAFAQQYQGAFTSRQTSIKKYDGELSAQAKQIKINTGLLERREEQIDKARDQLDSSRQAGNIAAYNAGVDSFNAQVQEYNDLLADTKAMIDSYNRLVEERNAIAAQTVELQKAISSADLPSSR